MPLERTLNKGAVDCAQLKFAWLDRCGQKEKDTLCISRKGDQWFFIDMFGYQLSIDLNV